ncbi:hypothetical protein BGZ58_003661 [Dissophora ornata]|nr:hypothetical protein BGZ58_003661 [Dissophora ornata]
MDTIHFPDTRLVRVGHRITQVATFISNQEGDPLQLSIEAQKLLQNIVWATIASPPSETTVELNHDEFHLTITQRPWMLKEKYDIQIDGEVIEPTPLKLWFSLSGPSSSSSSRTQRALIRFSEKAERDFRPLGIVPVIGSLDDLDLLTQEAANTDVFLHFADADHYPVIKVIFKGLLHRPRLDGGRNEAVYYDNYVTQLNALGPTQYHRDVDLEITSPELVGKIDTYIVAPPTIWGTGTGTGNHNSIQILHHVECSLKHGKALQIGKVLNIWGKLTLQGSDDGDSSASANRKPLPKNEDTYYFIEDGKFTYGEVAKS